MSLRSLLTGPVVPGTSGGRSADADRRLLRSAARSVAVQTAVAVSLVVLVVALGAVLVFERQQSGEIRETVQRAAATADDVDDPPAGVWLVQITPAAVGNPAARTASTGTPPAAVADPALDTAPLGTVTVTSVDQQWTGWVADRPTGRIVAVYDTARQEAEAHRLVVAVSAGGLLGVLLAALIGWFVGRRAVRPLGDALARQRRFVADASHELRTPLAVVNTRAQLLRMQHAAPRSEIAVELDQLVHDTRVLGDVVSDLLLAAQLDHAAPVGEVVDLAALAGDVVASMGPYAAERGVDLRVTTGPDGSDDAGPTSVVVLGAPTALRRAVSALVDNAVSHSPAGGGVELEVCRSNEEARLSVVDHGEGLDPADASRLVERFARGSTAGGGRRFGLGLALVDEVVRAHGGRLDIAGEPGHGSTFTLVLPTARERP